MGNVEKRKHDDNLPVRLRGGVPFKFGVDLGERELIDILKTIPKRYNTEQEHYHVWIGENGGRKMFTLSKREGQGRTRIIKAEIHSDPNLIMSRLSGRIYVIDKPPEWIESPEAYKLRIYIATAAFFALTLVVAIITGGSKDFFPIMKAVIFLMIATPIMLHFMSVVKKYRDSVLLDFLKAEFKQ